MRPVVPDDQAFDYLETQAIADFLATENEPGLNGIISSRAARHCHLNRCMA